MKWKVREFSHISDYPYITLDMDINTWLKEHNIEQFEVITYEVKFLDNRYVSYAMIKYKI